MATLNTCNPLFIRCIKPNLEKVNLTNGGREDYGFVEWKKVYVVWVLGLSPSTPHPTLEAEPAEQ